MKKRRKIKKGGFFAQCARCLLSAKIIIAVIVLCVLGTALFGYVVYEKSIMAVVDSKKALAAPETESSLALPVAPASTTSATLSSASGPEPEFSPLDLSYDIGVYVYSKKKYACNDYSNIYGSNYFSMRCKVPEGIWRGHLVKKVYVAGYSKLRIKANLGVKDYTDYFAECGHEGINRDDFVSLMALSYDPERSFDWDCNHEVPEEKWSMCQVNKIDPGVMAYCGLPMCTNGTSCDFEVDVSGKSAVYLLFSANDAWMADIEGSISNAQYSLIK